RKERDVVVKPILPSLAADLRYDEWEYTRLKRVEERSKGEIGYVHLRAMGGNDFTNWSKCYYPSFARKVLIIDVRHNQVANIDSWMLGAVDRKAWYYWSTWRCCDPTWDIVYGHRGHVVVVCDEFRASAGEAFTEGIRRLGIGKVIGTRTWGGEIWLSFSNRL